MMLITPFRFSPLSMPLMPPPAFAIDISSPPITLILFSPLYFDAFAIRRASDAAIFADIADTLMPDAMMIFATLFSLMLFAIRRCRHYCHYAIIFAFSSMMLRCRRYYVVTTLMPRFRRLPCHITMPLMPPLSISLSPLFFDAADYFAAADMLSLIFDADGEPLILRTAIRMSRLLLRYDSLRCHLLRH